MGGLAEELQFGNESCAKVPRVQDTQDKSRDTRVSASVSAAAAFPPPRSPGLPFGVTTPTLLVVPALGVYLWLPYGWISSPFVLHVEFLCVMVRFVCLPSRVGPLQHMDEKMVWTMLRLTGSNHMSDSERQEQNVRNV